MMQYLIIENHSLLMLYFLFSVYATVCCLILCALKKTSLFYLYIIWNLSGAAFLQKS